MEDVLTEPPPQSRFFPEDLDNFATPSPPIPSTFLSIYPDANPDTFPPSLLVIAISAPSTFLIGQISNKTPIGTLIIPEATGVGTSVEPIVRNKSCNIYAVDRLPAPAILVAFPFTIPAERSGEVAKVLLGEINAENVLILDGIQSVNYRSRLSSDEAVAFKLETQEQRRGGDPLVRRLEYLPSGSVIGGLGAALLGESQMRKKRATLCVTWPENGQLSVVPLLKPLLNDLGLDVAGFENWKNETIRVSSRSYPDLYA
ncbi:hypothetical protein HPP92_020023 [Vanilla planifolia]|uniref:Proteasome assembly chaperone 1 n=1 Tax=Vanilla planifolia TaxID=51239 RepID=A0A835Q1M2_VANPL|nr:hypothetical protein HPP92_020023 [Vanilla planifolia]